MQEAAHTQTTNGRAVEAGVTPRAVPDLAGRVVLVTGGGRGLGEALCRSLADAGAAVIAADVRDELARKVAASISEGGGTASAVSMDVADSTQVEQALAAIQRDYGRVDAVINNAGIDLTVSVEEMSVEDFQRILTVNLTGPFIVSKLALPLMRAQGGGNIINIVSTAAKRAWANASAYHASKWGLLGLSHALHVEARPYNVKVSAVISGGLRTPFLLDRFPDIDLNTLQDPRNVADTVRFLLTLPRDTVIPEIMVLPMRETSWP